MVFLLGLDATLRTSGVTQVPSAARADLAAAAASGGTAAAAGKLPNVLFSRD